jgi:hypothetical protein
VYYSQIKRGWMVVDASGQHETGPFWWRWFAKLYAFMMED